MTFDLTHVRHDPAHCLAPGLFRSLKRGDRKRLKLDVTYQYGKDTSIRFWGPEPLGADDMRILQGLVAMAAVSGDGGRGILLHPEPRTEAGQQLRLLLETKFDAIAQDAMVAKGSYRQLAKEVGYADIEDSRPIRDCIERLWAVSVIVESKGKRQGFRILSEYASDDVEGRLFVALNPRLADAIMGNAQHLHIDLYEVRRLSSDPARLVHQRLHWINAGTAQNVTLDTLCGYVWPDEATPEAMKKRRQTVRRALAELVSINWTVDEYAPGKFNIGRPKVARLLNA
jgi:hypothetical protein